SISPTSTRARRSSPTRPITAGSAWSNTISWLHGFLPTQRSSPASSTSTRSTICITPASKFPSAASRPVRPRGPPCPSMSVRRSHDLSAPDPYFVLPVVYAITAFLQVKLSPTPIQDPVQAKVMQIMPIAFSVLFLFFPSGLVLYWLINNSLQIFQQWHMNRVLEREAAAAAAKRR